MSGPGSDQASEPSEGDADEETTDDETVQRTFTCTLCGYGTTREVAALTAEVQSTCVNCGDWTVQSADPESVVEAARDVAERLAGEVLTERQALAYLLREVVGLERDAAAEAMDTSASNVDNLQRRGREKVSDATRVVEELEEVSPEHELRE